jgi:predicted nucleic acid-binding protein
MPITVDTRFFLIHYLADTEDLKLKTSRKMVELQREVAIVPTIVIHEVYKFIHENVGKDTALLRVNSILTSRLRIIDLNSKIAVTSAALRCRYRDLPTADSIIAGTSIEARSKHVLSDDPHFRKINEIQTEWL